MSISIKDCLNLPALSFGEVVAGAKGLGKIVTSVSVVEFFSFENEKINVFTPNELCISAFFSIRDDVEKQCRAIKELYNTGTVGLVLFYVGDVIVHLDDRVLNTANDLEFPLIIMKGTDYSLKYSDIIDNVMEAVILERRNENSDIEILKGRMKEFPLEHRTMENLLRLICNFYKCNIWLTYENKIYFEGIYKQSYGYNLFKQIVQIFKNDTDIFSSKELIDNDITYNAYKMDFEYEKDIRLTVYVNTYNIEIKESKISDICECIKLFSSVWGYPIDFKSVGTLVSLILKADLIVAEKYMAEHEIPLNKIEDIIIIEAGEKDIKEQKNALCNIFERKDIFYICNEIDDSLVFLSSSNIRNVVDDSLYGDLEYEVIASDNEASIFIGCKCKSLDSIKATYLYYRKNLKLIKQIYKGRSWNMNDIILIQDILDMAEVDNLRNKYINGIVDILQRDNEELLETLAVYLIDCNSKLNDTAKNLFLHRNTVTYRLEKIKKITGTDFQKMPDAYNFYVAAVLWRIGINKTQSE